MAALFADIITAILITMLVPLVIYSLVLAGRVYRTNNNSFVQMKESTGGFKEVLLGTVDTKKSSVRDHYVHAGLAYNKKDKTILTQGTISDEAVEITLR